MNKTLRKFGKNAKALSPVVASIILIAVTVAVSVVVAAWMGGMSIGLMGNAEQATITNIDTSVDPVLVTVQNTGQAVVDLKTGYLNNVAGAMLVISGSAATPSLTLDKGDTVTVSIAGTVPVTGDDITIKISTGKGNNLVYTQVVP